MSHLPSPPPLVWFLRTVSHVAQIGLETYYVAIDILEFLIPHSLHLKYWLSIDLNLKKKGGIG